MRDGKTAVGPAEDIHRWSANYGTQRSITREKSIALSKADRQIDLLRQGAIADSTALFECNEEKQRFKDGYVAKVEEITGLNQQLDTQGKTKTLLWYVVAIETALLIIGVAR